MNNSYHYHHSANNSNNNDTNNQTNIANTTFNLPEGFAVIPGITEAQELHIPESEIVSDVESIIDPNTANDVKNKKKNHSKSSSRSNTITHKNNNSSIATATNNKEKSSFRKNFTKSINTINSHRKLSNNNHINNYSYNNNNNNNNNRNSITSIGSFVLNKTNNTKESNSKHQYYNQHTNAEDEDNNADYVEDEEAQFKNLTFQGVPNTAKTYNNEGFKNNDTNTPPTQWLKKMNNTQRDSFHDFNNKLGVAIKKINKRLPKTQPTSSKHGLNKVATNSKNKFNEDQFVKDLASDLVDTLLAGCPASLFAASQFLYDDRGVKRAPLLLAMLGVHVSPYEVPDNNTVHSTRNNNTIATVNSTHSASSSSSSSSLEGVVGHKEGNELKYKIDLEYGVGDNRLRWTIYRSYRDLMSLHSKLRNYTIQLYVNNKIHGEHKSKLLQIPKFPRIKGYESMKLNTKTAPQTANNVINKQKATNRLIDATIADNNGQKISNTATNNNPKLKNQYKPTNTTNTVKKHKGLSGDNSGAPGLKNIFSKKSSTRNNNNLADNNGKLVVPQGSLTSSSSSKPQASPSPATQDAIHNTLLDDGESLSSTITSDAIVFQPSKKNLQLKQFRNMSFDLDDHNDPSLSLSFRLEKYLKILNIALCLRPIANKLFQFYELSPIGTLLSYENGYAGKQGYLIIASSAKANGWRVSHLRFKDWKQMVKRHIRKWFLVRHSYVMFVSDIHSSTPLDVFLVDSDFKVTCSGDIDEISKDVDRNLNWFEGSRLPKNLKITLNNGERQMKLLAKSELQMKEWVASLLDMQKSTIWSQHHRFDSFAPVRSNCFCKFLVDGRDYFWALSEALTMAQDVIFIHDWWLSPELYMRRPVSGNQKYRIDRILKERAERGVKVFIVVYRNVGSTVGTDSSWTKHSLLNLHENIHVIRSPNQWLQNTYFWAHHEKLTVIDHSIAFMGGIDLCFGRYDTPEHVLKDDSKNILNQNFPGKDYSNARVCDFYDLDKPFESMYDRDLVPRMPWHDVHMMTIGEAARDMSRHFVQRWNYLLRQKRPSRPTPLLTPPSDFTLEEMESSPLFRLLKGRSTCECQVIRSAGYWSLGLKETDHSIQNAYLKLIETSKHYMYIENQFFVTSSSWDSVFIENNIGNAIVDRIIKANHDGTKWKAFILIPLMPGFNSEVDKPEGSSIRLIMQCQFMSISRGETSIFGKLRKLGIDPLNYIQFYSLRKWSTLGPTNQLVTEQLYVHAKVLIVDDRSCIIGSANVNERSMAGNRDSEVAIVIRDNDLVKTKMDGKDYLAGRFAWELRQRLMREHIGCNVDLVEMIERKFGNLQQIAELNYKTLNTLNETDENDSKSNKKENKSSQHRKFVESAMIELAYREIFNEKSSPSWANKYADDESIVETKYGMVIEDEEDKAEEDEDDEDEDEEAVGNKQNQRKQKRQAHMFSFQDPLDYDAEISKAESEEILRSVQLPSVKDTYQFRNAYHSFNNRAGEANIGIKDEKPISTDPRISKNKQHIKDVEGLGADEWRKESQKRVKYCDSVTKQFMFWAENVFDNDLYNESKRQPLNLKSILPNREDVLEYLESIEVKNGAKWDMLKRICYLQHLAYKQEKKKESIKKNDKYGMADEKDEHMRHSELLEEQEMTNYEIDQILAFVAIPKSRQYNYFKNGYKKLTPISPTLLVNFVDPYSFEDPICDSFYQDLWFSIAVRNTYIYRLVFHCQPDNSVQTWKEFKDFKRLNQEFDLSQKELVEIEQAKHGIKTSSKRENNGQQVENNDLDGAPESLISATTEDEARALLDEDRNDVEQQTPYDLDNNTTNNERMEMKNSMFKMRLSGGLLDGFDRKIFDKYTATRLLQRIHGHLVVFPNDWLCREVESNNWFYNADRIPPIDIYD